MSACLVFGDVFFGAPLVHGVLGLQIGLCPDFVGKVGEVGNLENSDIENRLAKHSEMK